MIFNLDFRFCNVPNKRIDIERILEFIHDDNTKRINFAYVQPYALRPAEGIAGWLNLPFDEPFETIAKAELGYDRFLFSPKSGSSYYRRIDDVESYEKIRCFIDKYRDLVFLRDCLDLSFALSMHEDNDFNRTTIGEHEYRLKYKSDEQDTSENLAALIKLMQLRLEQLPYLAKVDYICAVPSSKPFMQEIINGLCGFTFTDISKHVSWKNKQGSLKNMEAPEEKLKLIDTWQFTVTEDVEIKGKTILLVDDMYKSGVTMQYVAMKLKELGASRVFGLALCKAKGNN